MTAPGPRSRRGERTSARLLDAARLAFREQGWARTRVEDICRAAGVGHGTFYAYYANRSDVLAALVRRHAADLYGIAERSWRGDSPDDVRRQVRDVIAGYVAVSSRDRDIREAWHSAAISEPELAALFTEVRRQFVARVGAALTAASAAGLVRTGLDVPTAATALTAMVEQTVTLALAGELDGAAWPQDPAAGPVVQLVDGLADLWVAAVYRSA